MANPLRMMPSAPDFVSRLNHELKSLAWRVTQLERHRRPVTRLRRTSGSTQAITTSTWTAVTGFETNAVRDDANLHTSGNDYLEIPDDWAGEWEIKVIGHYADVHIGTFCRHLIGISINSTTTATLGWTEAYGETYANLSHSRYAELAAGDRIRMLVWHDRGSNEAFGSGDSRLYPRLEMRFTDWT